MTPQQRAFLDMLAASEIGAALLAVSDNGYDIIVGSTPRNPIKFTSYKDHPRTYVKSVNSTAAGRYQILARYFDAYKKLLKLRDFSPASQDAIALQMIKEQRALADIEAGNFAAAVAKCRNIWASLPGAGYNQHENSLDKLQAAFLAAGGRLA